MTQFDLDVKDQKLIQCLYENGRVTFAEIGRRLNISKENSSFRLERLRERGIISSISPIVDYAAFGLQTYRILMSGNLIYDIDKIKSLVKIHWMVELSGGTWKLVISLLCKDSHDFAQKQSILFEHIIGINNYAVSQVLTIEHFSPQVITGQKKISYITGVTSKKELSEPEKKILRSLTVDGRKSVLDMAEEIKLTATPVTHHLRKLQPSVIQAIVPVLNYELLGFDHYKLMLRLENVSQRNSLIEYMRKHNLVIYITHAIGTHDAECELIAKRMQDVVSFCDELQKIIPLAKYEIIISKRVLIHHAHYE